MPQFDLLGPLMNDLHREFVSIYYLLLPVFFLIAVTLTWFRSPSGSPDFLDIIKRAVVATLLLVAFPDISRAILEITDSIALRIDEVNGIDNILKMAEQKSESYTMSASSLLLQFDDLIIATLSILSYIILYVARYLTIAMYHFFWLFFMVTSPLLILFYMFQGTSQITKNLFSGMIEVACWKIVWAILGAMLTALAFGDAYQAEGSYITLVVMNFAIASAMLMTPMLVKSLYTSGLTQMTGSIGSMATGAIVAGPSWVGKVASAEKTSRSALGAAGTYIGSNFKNTKSQDKF